MWKDRLEERYDWAHPLKMLDRLILELKKAEDDEDLAVHVLKVHIEDEADLSLFNRSERKRIKEILGVLIADTTVHQGLIAMLINEMSEKRKNHEKN